MDIPSIIILVIVALLVILAVRKAKKDKMISKCGGNCSACTLKCNKKQFKQGGLISALLFCDYQMA